MGEREYCAGGAWVSSSAADAGGFARGARFTPQGDPQRVEAARALFPEASLDEFEAVGVTGRRFRHRETGREYSVAQDQVLMERDPRKGGVEFFVLAAGQILFMRPRGWDGDIEVGIPGQIISGRLRQAPGGGVRVVDRSGNVVRDGVRL